MGRLNKNIFIINVYIISSVFTSCMIDDDWEGTVTYEVSGTATNVNIVGNGYYTVTKLPWSYSFKAKAYDDDPYDCYLEANNRNNDSSNLVVKIFVDGELKKQGAASGPYCQAVAEYTIWGDLE